MAADTQTLAARDTHGTARYLHAQVDDLYEGAVALRRRLHEWPEVGNHLPNTREAVLESLESLQERLHRVEQRMAQGHDADLRTTLTLTTVAPFA